MAGVTVHALAEEFDAGPIFARELLAYADGTAEEELEHDLALIGGRLLAETIRKLSGGNLETRNQQGTGSYEGWPSDDDYIIDTNRTARSAFNFIRGVSGRGVPVRIRDRDRIIHVDHAVSWSSDAPPLDHDVTVVRFSEGFLTIEASRIDDTLS